MAEERVKRNGMTMADALASVVADCLAKNEDPSHTVTLMFFDWNWRRLDAYKAARLAKNAALSDGAWLKHDGKGMPVPVGTICEVKMFNGVRHQMVAGHGTFDIDGTPIPAWRSAGWSAWDYDDGGPMGPKFQSYRVIAIPEQARYLPGDRKRLPKAA